MENRSWLFDHFERAFDELEESRALALLELSHAEASEVVAGLGSLPEPIQAACRVVIDQWGTLDAKARVAALLALANALAEASDA